MLIVACGATSDHPSLTLHTVEALQSLLGNKNPLVRARCQTNVQISFNVLNHVQIKQEAHENTRLRPHLHDVNNIMSVAFGKKKEPKVKSFPGKTVIWRRSYCTTSSVRVR